MSQSSGDPRPITALPLTARSMWRRMRWTILGVIASVLAAWTCLSMAVSGPPALNCVGASDAIAPSAVTDKTIAFSGGDISFTAPFEATAPWTLEWSTNANTAMVWLYDARVDVSSPNTWNRGHAERGVAHSARSQPGSVAWARRDRSIRDLLSHGWWRVDVLGRTHDS